MLRIALFPLGAALRGHQGTFVLRAAVRAPWERPGGAHAATAARYLASLERLRAVLNSATTASTSMRLAASNRSKVLLAFLSDAMSASACPWVGMK